MHLNSVLFGLKNSLRKQGEICFYVPIVLKGSRDFTLGKVLKLFSSGDCGLQCTTQTLTFSLAGRIIITDKKRRCIATDNIFNSKEYKRSRGAYALQATLEYLITLMVTDAFLTDILRHLGISDSMIGIIATFVSLAMVIQLGSLSISKTKVSSKKIVTLFSCVSQALFVFVYVIPFLPLSDTVKKILAILCILIAYSSMYIVWPILYRWAYKFVAPQQRARYSASKEMLSLGLGVAFTLLVGFVIDKCEGLSNVGAAFVFIAISMAIISVCNMVCLLLMKEEPMTENSVSKKKFSDIMKNTFGNRGFNVCVFTISLWEFARFFQLGFMGPFKKDLIVSTFAIQVINMAGLGARLVLSKPVAKYSDKHGYAKGYELGLVIAAAAFFFNMFSSKTTWFFVVIYSVLHHLCYVGINSNGFNMLYSYVDNEYISEALAIKNAIAGVVGFAAALVGGILLDCVQNNGNTVLGINIYGQQLLSAVSFLVTVVVLVFVKTVLAKQKKVE